MITNSHSDSPFQFGLVSMPWSILNRPSIQLGALKSYLDHKASGSIACTLFHPYLGAAVEIGTENYHYLAKNSWAGEALYSPMVHPEQWQDAKKLFDSSCRKDKDLRGLNFSACNHRLEKSLEHWLAEIDFSSYQLLGFSICFNQLLSSLTAAKKIKELVPDLPIVIGGSGCVGDIGRSLLANYHQIDYVINGEGEEALLQLCLTLQNPGVSKDLPSQVMTRATGNIPGDCCRGIRDLNQLPAPDYAPYFKEMAQHFPSLPFVPTLPLEFSRGCWWNKCSFCNLNLQWHGYRWKSAQTMLQELQLQKDRYRCLDFCFTDNALPPKEASTFFDTLARDNNDYEFFAEVRVLTDPETPRRYRLGGLKTIQVGIESLSTGLLQRMQKGTTAIENIAAMRQSAEAGIQLDGNLITEFPGSLASEIQETLDNLDFVLPYPAMSAASFFLGHGSAVALDPARYGILAVTQHPKNRQLFPRAILNELTMLIKEYRGDRVLQRRQWHEVTRKIARWRQFHQGRTTSGPPLSYRDGKSFLLIRQEQLAGPTLRHRLQGTSREIYLFCRSIRSLEEIGQAFPSLKEGTLSSFFRELIHKRLLFQEEDRVLALAIRPEAFSSFPSI